MPHSARGVMQGPPPQRPPKPTAVPEETVTAIPRRGHLGPLSLAQILVAEGSLLGIVAAATQGVIPALVTTVAAAALLFVFFARGHDRWWLEHRALTRDHRRRRSARREAEAGPVLAALRTIAPGLRIRDVHTTTTGQATRETGTTGLSVTATNLSTTAIGEGTTTSGDGTTTGGDEKPTGVARDEAGWFGVVALDEPGPVPLDTLIAALAATDQPGLTLELVTHTVPAPTPDLPPTSPAITSYRLFGDGAPAHRESSLSVRLDAKALAESVMDHTTDPSEAARLTAALTRKLATTLRRQGIPNRVLDAGELLATLARSCDIDVSDPYPAEVAEEWNHWRSHHLIHRTYWLETWPESVTDMGPLLSWASAAPASQTSVALILDATHADDIAIRALIRLSTRPDADLDALGEVLREGARRAGAELRSLDGEQGIAAYATAPTGGGAG
ncbi:type VII secretion protein EccE [Actinoplanes sp. NPDC023714]|uniref:type VII secretion protein EccE n=1 Tax=Actinoplanes sp. NPDC023714 TaxID=3154322 RepID=UPI0033F6DE7D